MTRVESNVAVVRSHGLELTSCNPSASGKPDPRIADKNVPGSDHVLSNDSLPTYRRASI
jgi:hypothetical protein